MFDLQSRIHLDEVELAVLVEELDRPGAGIAERGDGVGDDAANAGALLGVDDRGGRFLQHLLVAPLQRAVALAEMNGAALAVAHHLHLDVARMGQILLDVDGVVAERGACLRAGVGERVGEFVGARGHLHAASAAAGRCLDQHRVADLGGDLARRRVVADGTLRTRNHGNAKAGGGALRLDLVAHDADVVGARTDEGDVVRLKDFGEAGVLGQEAVAGMHGFGAGDLAGGEQLRDVEIGIARRRRTDAHAFVGEADMHGVGVGGGMHRDGGDAELLAGAQHPEGDLAAIGNQDLVEEVRRAGHSMIIKGSPYSTG